MIRKAGGMEIKRYIECFVMYSRPGVYSEIRINCSHH